MVRERCLLLRPGETLSLNVETRSLPPENVFCRPSQNDDPLMLKPLPTPLNYLKARGRGWDVVRKRPSPLCLDAHVHTAPSAFRASTPAPLISLRVWSLTCNSRRRADNDSSFYVTW